MSTQIKAHNRLLDPLNIALKKFNANFSSLAERADQCSDDLIVASIFTLALTTFTIIYLVIKFRYISQLGEYIGLYVAANVIQLCRYVNQSLFSSDWTLDQLGNMLSNYIRNRNDANDL